MMVRSYEVWRELEAAIADDAVRMVVLPSYCGLSAESRLGVLRATAWWG